MPHNYKIKDEKEAEQLLDTYLMNNKDFVEMLKIEGARSLLADNT